MIKTILKVVLSAYWIGMNLFGLFNLCSISCGLTLANTLGSLVYILVILFPGIIFILKSFKLEWYKCYWTYLMYFVLIMYPLIFIQATRSLLCACSSSF